MNADIGFLMTRNKVNEKTNKKRGKLYDSIEERKGSNKPLTKMNGRIRS